MRKIIGAAVFYACIVMLVGSIPAAAQHWVPYTGTRQTGHVVTPPVHMLPKAPLHPGPAVQVPLFHRPAFVSSGQQTPTTDQAVQTTSGTSLTASPKTAFGGVGFNGYYPPDPNISVGGQDSAGNEEVVQVTNVEFAVYDAANGALLSGPTLLNSLFSSLKGTLCSTNNGGDPIVLWDKIAHRWLISQIAYSNNFRNDEACIAISQNEDATGSYYAYGFSFNHLTDYPKFGIWSSSSPSGTSDYYFSANLFSKALYYGPVVCAFNGSDMQSDATARYACSQGSTSDFSLLPSDFDGTPPATGEPNYFLELGTGGVASSGSSLIMYPFLATWSGSGGKLNNPSGITIPVDTYNVACTNGGACIPQPGTNSQLDSLGDRLMYRLAFRNNLSTDSHETLVVNHAVDKGNGVVGIRWYEINSATGATFANSVSGHNFTGTVEQGTFSGADNNYRWMGSIAEDHSGDLALGYSVSNGNALYPSINITGRTPGDPAGTMEAENTIKSGTGSETGGSRWGDYTSMSVDPADDCTFWYTNEYFTPNAAGGVAWNTYIGSFAFSGCSGSTSQSFSLSASPSSLSVTQGSTTPETSSISMTSYGGFSGTVSLTASAPSGSGLSVGISPGSISGTQTSTLTVGAGTATSGTYTVTVTGTSGSLKSSTNVTVTVNPASSGGGSFTISASPSTQTISAGGSTTYTVSVGFSNGFSGTVSLNVSGLPKFARASFSTNPVSVPGDYLLTINTNRNVASGTSTLTITGTDSSGTVVQSNPVSLIVQ